MSWQTQKVRNKNSSPTLRGGFRSMFLSPAACRSLEINSVKSFLGIHFLLGGESSVSCGCVKVSVAIFVWEATSEVRTHICTKQQMRHGRHPACLKLSPHPRHHASQAAKVHLQSRVLAYDVAHQSGAVAAGGRMLGELRWPEPTGRRLQTEPCDAPGKAVSGGSLLR